MRESKCPFMRLIFFLLSLTESATAALMQYRRPHSRPHPLRAPRCPGGGTAVAHTPASMHHQGDIIILGAGWVGSRLAARLHGGGVGVRVTNRPAPPSRSRLKSDYYRPVPLPSSLPHHDFDMAKRDTWDALPPPSSLRAAVITFSAMPEHCEPFWDEYLRHVPRVLCYSSTAVYQVETPGQRVDERTPLRATPRAQAEEFLRARGATVLTISGIFGAPQGARGVCTCLAQYANSGAQLSVWIIHIPGE